MWIISSRRYNNPILYAPKNRTYEYMRQTLTDLKGQLGKAIYIVGVLNTCLSVIDTMSRYEIEKSE